MSSSADSLSHCTEGRERTRCGRAISKCPEELHRLVGTGPPMSPKFVSLRENKERNMSSTNEPFQLLWSVQFVNGPPISAPGGSHVTFRDPIPSHRRRQELRHVQMGTAAMG